MKKLSFLLIVLYYLCSTNICLAKDDVKEYWSTLSYNEKVAFLLGYNVGIDVSSSRFYDPKRHSVDSLHYNKIISIVDWCYNQKNAIDEKFRAILFIANSSDDIDLIKQKIKQHNDELEMVNNANWVFKDVSYKQWNDISENQFLSMIPSKKIIKVNYNMYEYTDDIFDKKVSIIFYLENKKLDHISYKFYNVDNNFIEKIQSYLTMYFDKEIETSKNTIYSNNNVMVLTINLDNSMIITFSKTE